MFGFFKDRKKKKDMEKRVEAVSSVFAQFDRFAEAGLLVLDRKKRMVYISRVVAQLFMADESTWKAFGMVVADYISYRYSMMRWEEEFRKAELVAVQKASEKHSDLTDEQIRLIRQEARGTVEYDPETFKPTETYQFCLFDGAVVSDDVELVSAGVFSGGEMEMVEMEKVRELDTK